MPPFHSNDKQKPPALSSRWRNKKTNSEYIVERIASVACGDVWVAHVIYCAWEERYGHLGIPRLAKRYGRSVDEFWNVMEVIG
jgi:hypothetical protein